MKGLSKLFQYGNFFLKLIEWRFEPNLFEAEHDLLWLQRLYRKTD
jgi:hypothetical protein